MFIKNLVLIVLISIFSLPTLAVDFSKFLSGHKLIMPQGPVPPFNADHDENFVLQDPTGRSFLVVVPELMSRAYTQIGCSMLMAALGLPQLPSYPFFWGPQYGRRTARAIIQPVVKFSKIPWDKLYPEQKAELFSLLVFHFVVGSDNFNLGDGTSGNLNFRSNTFISPSFGKAFTLYLDSTQQNETLFNHLLSAFPFKNMGSREDQELFAQKLDRLFWAMESIGQSELKSFFPPLVARSLQDIDLTGKLYQNLQMARRLSLNYLSTHSNLGPAAKSILGAQHQQHSPFVRLPIIPGLSRGQIPSVTNVAAVQALWYFYFLASGDRIAQTVGHWTQELKLGAEESLVGVLAQMASVQNYASFVSPALPLSHRVAHQIVTNNANARTALVMPEPKGAAARMAIYDAAKRLGLEIILWNPEESSGLLSKLQSSGNSRVLFFQIPFSAYSVLSEALKLQKIEVSYHSNKRRLPLDWFAYETGYVSSLFEFLNAVFDSRGFNGLKELGLKQETVMDLFSKRHSPGSPFWPLYSQFPVNLFTVLSGTHGQVYLSQNPAYSPYLIYNAFGLHHYADTVSPQMLILGSVNHFFGDPQVVAQLQARIPNSRQNALHHWQYKGPIPWEILEAVLGIQVPASLKGCGPLMETGQPLAQE
ncbi:MAG: hypothetical protein WCG27_00780 [Pseudomonadota bacterium]